MQIRRVVRLLPPCEVLAKLRNAASRIDRWDYAPSLSETACAETAFDYAAQPERDVFATYNEPESRIA